MCLLRVDITEKFIRRGQSGKSRTKGCPIYLGIKAVEPRLSWVGGGYAVFDLGGRTVKVELPTEAVEFQRVADMQRYVEKGVVRLHDSDPDGRPLEPIKFNLLLPHEP